MAMAGRSAARRRPPENLGNMCKSARASGTEESLGLESGLRHFKNPTKIEIFGNGELPMQKPWNPVQKLWNPMQNAMDSYANGYGFLCKMLWIPMQKAMGSYAKGYGFLCKRLWLMAQG